MRDVKDNLRIIFRYLPGEIRAPLERAAPYYEKDVQEIILRAGRAVVIECGSMRYYLKRDGTVTTTLQAHDLTKSSISDILDTFKSICDFSVYARLRELVNGYITIRNGVRVGVSGTAVEGAHENLSLKDITTLSFRVPSEMIGCSGSILNKVDPLYGILLCGAPCSGKTTLIRDMARVLSERRKVSIIDERNEISATVDGVCGYDIGYSDVFVGMEKGVGIIRALRSLSPDIIVCDELGDREDVLALSDALRCGTAVIATAHARNLEDLRRRKLTADLLSTGAFRYAIFLSDRSYAGQVHQIYKLTDV